MRTVVLALAVLLLAAALAPVWADGEGALISRWEGLLPDPAQDHLGEDADAWPEYFVCRILDAETRTPIPDARWIRTPEWIAPWRLHHDAVLSVGVSDEDGVAVLPTEGERWRHDCHWLVTAPGYAAVHEYGEVPEAEVLLERGVAFEGRVLDPLGRPVAGATVEILGGCSHGTAAARATADADGGFLIPHVPADLPGQVWVEGKGIASDLLALSSPDSLGGGEVALWMGTGVRYEGRVVDLLGRPMQGVVVRAWNEQRGPTAMTDAAGDFVLDGVEPDYDLLLYSPADLLDGDSGRRVEDAHPGVPLRIVVTPVGIPEEEVSALLLVRVRDAQGVPVPGQSLAAIETTTGRGPREWTSEKEDDPDDPPAGTALLEVVPGAYRIVSDEPFGPFAFEAVEVEARAHQTAIVDVTVRARPRLVIEGEIPDEALLVLAVPGAETADDVGEGAAWSPSLPADGPAALRVEVEGRPPFAFSVGSVHDGLRRVVVSLPAPRRIPLPPGSRYVDLQDGSRAAFHTAPKDGWITSDARGPLVLGWMGPDGEDHQARVVLPTSGDALVSVDEIAPRETPGEWVAVRRPGWRTLWARDGGEGEARGSYGPASLNLRIRDEDGPVDALVLVAGEVYAAPEGVLELQGFPEGPVRIVVGRRGVHGLGRVVHVDLREAASPAIVVALPFP